MKHGVECIGVITGTAVKLVPVQCADRWDIPCLTPIHVPSYIPPRLVSRASARSEPSSEEHVPNQLFYSVGTETKLNCSANVDQSRSQSNRVRIYFQPHCEF